MATSQIGNVMGRPEILLDVNSANDTARPHQITAAQREVRVWNLLTETIWCR